MHPFDEPVSRDNINQYLNAPLRKKLPWARNNKVDEFTTTTKNERVRPDVLVYCRNVLVMMGEEKAAHTTLQTAAEELNDCFGFWNTLASGDLPLVIAFAAVGSFIIIM